MAWNFLSRSREVEAEFPVLQYLPHLINLDLCAQSLSHVQLFATPRTVARQTPLSMGFSRQEYWSGLPCPPLGNLPSPGMEPRSPTLQANSILSISLFVCTTFYSWAVYKANWNFSHDSHYYVWGAYFSYYISLLPMHLLPRSLLSTNMESLCDFLFVWAFLFLGTKSGPKNLSHQFVLPHLNCGDFSFAFQWLPLTWEECA